MNKRLMVALLMIVMATALVMPVYSRQQKERRDPKAYETRARPEWTIYDWCSAHLDFERERGAILTSGEHKAMRAIRIIVSRDIDNSLMGCDAWTDAIAKTDILNMANFNLTDLGPIASMPQIKELVLDNNRITTLDQIKDMPNLRVVTARKNPVKKCPQFKAEGVQCIIIDE